MPYDECTFMKQCTKCKAIKPISEFYRDARKRNGLFSACKCCHNKLTAAWTADNHERKRKTNQLWQEANRERRQEAFKRRYQRTDALVPTDKVCSSCGENKRASDFHRKKDARDGLYPRCKPCRAKGDQEWRKNNAQYLAAYEHKRYLTDPRRREAPKKWYVTNRARALQKFAAYAQTNPEVVRAAKRRYVALHGHYSRRLNQAAVRWADIDAVYLVYKERDRLTSLTGVKHHVDHIVPIRNDWVCGLHNEFNLQVTTAAENLSKNNRYWPDMPDTLDRSVRSPLPKASAE